MTLIQVSENVLIEDGAAKVVVTTFIEQNPEGLWEMYGMIGGETSEVIGAFQIIPDSEKYEKEEEARISCEAFWLAVVAHAGLYPESYALMLVLLKQIEKGEAKSVQSPLRNPNFINVN